MSTNQTGLTLGWVIVYVDDVAATLRFYQRCFGLLIRLDVGDFGELETGSTALAFASKAFVAGQGVDFRGIVADEAPPGVQVTLVADDVPVAFDRAVQAGAHPVKAPHRAPHGQDVSYVRDLNGFLVEIASPVGAETRIEA